MVRESNPSNVQQKGLPTILYRRNVPCLAWTSISLKFISYQETILSFLQLRHQQSNILHSKKRSPKITFMAKFTLLLYVSRERGDVSDNKNIVKEFTEKNRGHKKFNTFILIIDTYITKFSCCS